MTRSFIIEPESLTINYEAGSYIARYPHPYVHTRLGLANLVVAKADAPEDAIATLIDKLTALGGVQTAEVV